MLPAGCRQLQGSGLCSPDRKARVPFYSRILLSKHRCLLFDEELLMQSEAPVYERIVLKLSGEAVQERGGRDNISPKVVREISERIKEVRDLGVQVAFPRRIAAWIVPRRIIWGCLPP
jgi:hypothetical protein